MTPDRLLSTWASLADESASPAGVQRIRLDTDTPADVFACIFWPSRKPGLLVEGAGEHGPSSDRIPTCRGVRMVHEVTPAPNSRTLLRVMLEDKQLLDIFAIMSADLVNLVSAQQSAAMALRRCIDRLCMWQGLFERVPAEGLSEEKQRGMLGELLVMETLLLPRLDPLAAVESWAGPDPAHQDFLRSGLAIEVKTSVAKRHVRILIASEKQLDERPHDTLVVAHLSLDESTAHGDSLPMLVGRVRGLVAHDPVASRVFDDRLLLGGYLDLHAPQYQRRWRCSGTRYYRVEGDFPRLTEANLPAGVGDIRYSIIADDLEPFELASEDVASLVEATDG
jgi:hypothetical protein